MSRLDELKKKVIEETPVTNNSDGPSVDYEALNKYMVETVGLEQEETVIGIISGVVNLGLQEQQDGRVEWNGSPEDEQAEIDKNPNTYFETDYEGKRWKRWPTKPAKSVALVIDFPEIIVDKAPFFGAESNPAPLRICMNGSFWRTELGMMTLGRPYPMNLRKNEKTNNQWSMLPNNTLCKAAVMTKTITKGDAFLPQNVIDLLGKSMLFSVSVFFNAKGYYTERVKLAGGLMRGQQVPEYDEDLLFYTDMNITNDPVSIKYLTAPIINTMKLSPEYEDSKIKQQIEDIHSYQKNNSKPDEGLPDNTEYGVDHTQESVPPISDDDIPF